jgi:hypothetical protein
LAAVNYSGLGGLQSLGQVGNIGTSGVVGAPLPIIIRRPEEQIRKGVKRAACDKSG